MGTVTVKKYWNPLMTVLLSSVVVYVYADVTLRLRDAAVVYNQSFALVCYTTVDASPQFASFYRSLSANNIGIPVAVITYNGSGSCQPSQSSSPNYVYSCDNNGKEITLTVPADNLNEHDTVWRCINPGGLVVANNNIVPIFVNVAVSQVQLSPAATLTLRELESRTLTCTTSFCRPKAVISWWKNDVNITNVANSSMYNQNTTTGILVYTGNRLDNGHSIACKAWNGYGNQQTSQQTILNIRYEPADPPTIRNYSNGSVFNIIENTSQVLDCIVTGGNPLAYLFWDCFGLAASSNTVNQTVTSTITLTVNRSRDRQQCRCVSSQEVQGNKTTFVQVNVLFPPSLGPIMSYVKVIEGHSLELVCRAEGNPAAQLKWSPQGEDTENQSRLYYHNISKSNHGNYTCTATNTMEPTIGNPVTQSDFRWLVVEVLYPPVLMAFISPIKVIEGDPFEVECKADGNPPPQLTWIPRGEDFVNQSRLYYHSISRSNHGNHTCTANNTMEPTMGSPVTWSVSKGLVIDILYRASIINFTAKDNNNLIMENDSLQLHCQVDSNPYSDIFLYHDNVQLKNEETALKLNYTKTVGCLDGGNYTCHASNSVMNGESVSSNLLISVACSPRLDHRKNMTTEYYSGLNNNITLEVYVIAYPEPNKITWYHRENNSGLWQTVPHQDPSSGGLFSSIQIQLISLRDFGYYMVTMENHLGNFSYTYSIIPASPPETPANLSVVPDSVTTHSLQLIWQAGFHGGASQTFVIEYREAGSIIWLNKKEPRGLVLYVTLNSTITDLKDGTTYEFRIYSENVFNRSQVSSTINETTKTVMKEEPENPNGSPVIIGASTGSALVMVIAVAIVGFLFYKRRQTIKSSEEDIDVLQGEKSLSDSHKSGLVDNPVYDSSGAFPDPSTSGSTTGVEYAAVVKPKKKGVQVEDLSSLYAQVDKTKNGKKKGQVKEKHGKAHRGDIYENATLAGRDNLKGNMYENSEELKAGENIYENPSEKVPKRSLAKKDDLLYADLAMDSPTTKNGKYVIRGLENRTQYAEIAYGKRGEPLPDNKKEK